MTWAKLDDGFYSHPKILRADLQAIGLYCLSLAYSACHELDGAVPAEAVAMLARGDERLAEQLVTLGLYEPQPFGYKIHDFLRYNPSARQVRKQRKEVKDRVVKYRARNALQTRISHALPRDGTGRVSSSVSSLSPKKKERTPCQAFPDDFVLTEMAAAKFRAKGCRDPAAAFAQFRNHHLAKGSRMVSWTHALATWLGNHGRYGCDGCPAATTARRARPTTTDDAVHSLAAKLYAEGKV